MGRTRACVAWWAFWCLVGALPAMGADIFPAVNTPDGQWQTEITARNPSDGKAAELRIKTCNVVYSFFMAPGGYAYVPARDLKRYTCGPGGFATAIIETWEISVESVKQVPNSATAHLTYTNGATLRSYYVGAMAVLPVAGTFDRARFGGLTNLDPPVTDPQTHQTITRNLITCANFLPTSPGRVSLSLVGADGTRKDNVESAVIKPPVTQVCFQTPFYPAATVELQQIHDDLAPGVEIAPVFLSLSSPQGDNAKTFP